MCGQMKKMRPFQKSLDTTIRFIGEVAPWLFPDDVREPAFLEALRKQLALVFCILGPITTYCTDGLDTELTSGLMHPNLQVDNAFFWTDEEGEYHAGLFDWGGCGYMPYAGIFLGCVSGALPEVYLEHEERWFRTFASEFKRFGGGDIDADELIKQCRLMFATSVVNNCQQVTIQAMSLTTEEEWKTITSKFDEKVMGRWNVRCNALACEMCFPVWR